MPYKRLRAFFAGYLQYLLAQVNLSWFLYLDIAKKGMDGNKPLVSGRNGTVSFILKPVQEVIYQFCAELFEG